MPFALITGASKGIGKALAEEIARKGYDLLLVARTTSLLEALSHDIQARSGREVRFLALDLNLPGSVDTILEYIAREQIQINILINNAGYGLWGRFDTLSLKDQNSMMNINMGVMIALIHGLLPLLKANKPSFIMNVASTAAYQAVPTLGIYAASKSFVILFTRALRRELKDIGISVTCLSPGPTETQFMNAAGMTTPEMIKRASKFNMKPEKVAAFAVNGMLKGRNEIIPGFINKFSVWMTYFVPKALTEKIAEGLYK